MAKVPRASGGKPFFKSMKAKNITTELKEFSEITDAVQTGEIKANLGDTINGKFLMVTDAILAAFPDPMEKILVYVEERHNTSTGHKWTETFLQLDPLPPFNDGYEHIESKIISSTPYQFPQ